jgi:TolA-binding protein
MGEIQLAWKNYPAAIQSFQTVLYSYPTGNKVPDAHVKMGLAYADIRQYAMARNILNEVLARYPDNARIRAIALKKLNELNNLY